MRCRVCQLLKLSLDYASCRDICRKNREEQEARYLCADDVPWMLRSLVEWRRRAPRARCARHDPTMDLLPVSAAHGSALFHRCADGARIRVDRTHACAKHVSMRDNPLDPTQFTIKE